MVNIMRRIVMVPAYILMWEQLLASSWHELIIMTVLMLR